MLRAQEDLSVTQISARMTREGMPISPSGVSRIISKAGVPKLWRRTQNPLKEARPTTAPVADHNTRDLTPRRLRTGFSGLFLFAADLACCDLDGILQDVGMPGSSMIPAGCAVRSLLALKFWG